MGITVKAQEAGEGVFVDVTATHFDDGSPVRSHMRVDVWHWAKDGDNITLWAEHDFSKDSDGRTHSISVPINEDCTCNVEWPKLDGR